jgi:hypothetical protein
MSACPASDVPVGGTQERHTENRRLRADDRARSTDILALIDAQDDAARLDEPGRQDADLGG